MDYSFLGTNNNPVTLFTFEDKKKYLSDPGLIDKGIKELADAINSVNVLFTMNSCQGFLIESEREEHCQETYVDFYVVNHQNHIANMLLTSLVSKFDALVDCKLIYEADYNFISEDEVEVNGFVNLRYGIKLYELMPDLMETTYKEIIEHIKIFAKEMNKKKDEVSE
ncbi:MAG: hypothetical protein JJE18_05130 [Eubacteriaceae bacterium]|nr:hypothetical protein [Eubacteriaceae bacterium]